MPLRPIQFGAATAIVVTALLLGGMTAEQMSRRRPGDAEPYHRQVRRFVEHFPVRVGRWSSVDITLPAGALKLLKPNAVLSRRYTDTQTGRAFSLLVIQCRDARDLAGHYPLNCYPASGWSLSRMDGHDWSVDGRTWPGMWYCFEQAIVGQTQVLHVANLLVLPDGRLTRSMGDVYDLAADYTRRFYGAAQVQFVFSGPWSQDDRDQTVALFLKELAPVIDQIRMGVTP